MLSELLPLDFSKILYKLTSDKWSNYHSQKSSERSITFFGNVWKNLTHIHLRRKLYLTVNRLKMFQMFFENKKCCLNTYFFNFWEDFIHILIIYYWLLLRKHHFFITIYRHRRRSYAALSLHQNLYPNSDNWPWEYTVLPQNFFCS